MITTSPLPLSQLLSPLSQYHRFRNITTITTSPLSQYRSGLKVELLCYGWQWMRNGCQISTVKRSHSQEISQPKKISQPRDLTAKRSHSQKISQPRDPKRSHSQERSLARSVVFVSYKFRFWGKSRTKCVFERYRCTKCCVLQDKTCPGRWLRKLVRRTVAEHGCGTHSFRAESAPQWKWQCRCHFHSFNFQKLRNIEGCLARKRLDFHIFNVKILRDVSRESIVFTSSMFRFWGMSRTKASFLHLQLSLFILRESLAQKLRFRIFHFQILREVLCGMCRGRLLWRRDPFLEQVLSQRRADMIWDCVESWDEVRGADKSWHLLRRCEKSLDDVRKGEKRWEGIRWADMSCGKLRRVEKSCENLRKAEISWDEKRWEKLRWHEKRWEQLWSAEKSWERERRHQMGWGDEVKNLRRHEMSWDEMWWHRLRWQRDAASSFQEKLRCDEIRWNEKRFNIQKAWHQIDKSGACCGEAQEACLSPICTAFAPLYRL